MKRALCGLLLCAAALFACGQGSKFGPSQIGVLGPGNGALGFDPSQTTGCPRNIGGVFSVNEGNCSPYKGEFQPFASYSAGDMVTDASGMLYVSRVSANVGTIPHAGGARWKCLTCAAPNLQGYISVQGAILTGDFSWRDQLGNLLLSSGGQPFADLSGSFLNTSAALVRDGRSGRFGFPDASRPFATPGYNQVTDVERIGFWDYSLGRGDLFDQCSRQLNSDQGSALNTPTAIAETYFCVTNQPGGNPRPRLVNINYPAHSSYGISGLDAYIINGMSMLPFVVAYNSASSASFQVYAWDSHIDCGNSTVTVVPTGVGQRIHVSSIGSGACTINAGNDGSHAVTIGNAPSGNPSSATVAAGASLNLRYVAVGTWRTE